MTLYELKTPLCEVCNGEDTISGLITTQLYDLFECGDCGALYRRTFGLDRTFTLARMR